ncbi:hypothetical protein [Aquisphaera insulae]|uniref:hypothetical protein n=1 Tax=Aquisphaera insulae TaxID=2712864 RepID=UPI0013ED1ECE|nr:hypothetical protein [Aquisphaera insulae]
MSVPAQGAGEGHSTSLDRELQSFTIELFDRVGGVADWPEPESPGAVVVPPALAKEADLPGEEFEVSTVMRRGALHVSLASDFLDVAGRVLDLAIPRDGSFRIGERYLTSRDLSERVARTFVWQNARALPKPAEPGHAEYHIWNLHASIRSEDVWERLFRVAVNARTGAPVDLPDIFQEPGLAGDVTEEPSAMPGPSSSPTTYAAAVAESKRRMVASSSEFVRRIEGRMDRDRKRLQEYYRALSREALGSKRRGAEPPSPEEVASRKKAVDLELRRKLAELGENYALRAEVRPIVLARVTLPVLIVPITIQRKQARRLYHLFWNPLLRALEPLSCSRCHRPTFSATFTNDTVDLLCTPCSETA